MSFVKAEEMILTEKPFAVFFIAGEAIKETIVKEGKFREFRYKTRKLMSFYSSSFSSVPNFKYPKNLHYLQIIGNKLKTIKNIPESIKYLHVVSGEKILNFPEPLPRSLKVITFSRRNKDAITKIPDLSYLTNLKHINFSKTNISKIPKLPLGIQEIIANNTKVKTFPSDLLKYKKLKWLVVRDNGLDESHVPEKYRNIISW